LAMNCLSQRQGSRETATERSTETGRQRQRRALLEIGVRLDFHHFQADGVSATCDAPGLCVKAPRTSEGRSAFEDENRVSANYSKSSLTPIAHRVYAARVCPLPSRFGRPFIPGSIGCARLGHSSTAVSAAFLACHFSRNSLKNLFFDAEAERAESQRRNSTTSPREKSSSPLRSCGSRRQKKLDDVFGPVFTGGVLSPPRVASGHHQASAFPRHTFPNCPRAERHVLSRNGRALAQPVIASLHRRRSR